MPDDLISLHGNDRQICDVRRVGSQCSDQSRFGGRTEGERMDTVDGIEVGRGFRKKGKHAEQPKKQRACGLKPQALVSDR